MSTTDSIDFRATLGQFATGVTIVTSTEDDAPPCGLTVNSFTSVSLDPPTVLVCLAKTSASHDCVIKSGRFCVNILDADGRELAERFWKVDRAKRYEGVAWHTEATGAPVLDDALAWIDCQVTESVSVGTHTVFFGAVERFDRREGRPLLFAGGAFTEL